MSNNLHDVRIARVSTIPFFVLTQLRTQLEYLVAAQAQVTIITSQEELTADLQKIEGSNFKPVYIAREINLWHDLKALIQLWRLFQRERFQIIHSTTPKAGLLCAIAAKLARTPVSIHTFTGQPWVTMSGFKKYLVKWSDKFIAALNVMSYTDSFSQRNFLIANKIADVNKIKVIGNGSLAGVDTSRFALDRFSLEHNQQLKASFKIAPSTKIVLFVGRVTQDKGIFDLFEAIGKINSLDKNFVLVVVGPFEQDNETHVRKEARKWCNERVIFTGFQVEPERFFAIADVLCLPSYREGFGTVVIEAAAMAVPAIGTNIYGLSDAIVDGVTGILVDAKNSSQLSVALENILSNDALRIQLGRQARARVLKEFDSKKYNKLLQKEYQRLLNKDI